MAVEWVAIPIRKSEPRILVFVRKRLSRDVVEVGNRYVYVWVKAGLDRASIANFFERCPHVIRDGCWKVNRETNPADTSRACAHFLGHRGCHSAQVDIVPLGEHPDRRQHTGCKRRHNKICRRARGCIATDVLRGIRVYQMPQLMDNLTLLTTGVVYGEGYQCYASSGQLRSRLRAAVASSIRPTGAV